MPFGCSQYGVMPRLKGAMIENVQAFTRSACVLAMKSKCIVLK